MIAKPDPNSCAIPVRYGAGDEIHVEGQYSVAGSDIESITFADGQTNTLALLGGATLEGIRASRDSDDVITKASRARYKAYPLRKRTADPMKQAPLPQCRRRRGKLRGIENHLKAISYTPSPGSLFPPSILITDCYAEAA